MTKTVSAYEARTKLGELMNLVYYKGDEVIVEKMGKPMVKLIKADAENIKKFKKKIRRKKSFDDLYGSWTKKEAEEFDKVIDDAFEQINPESWR